MWREELVFAIYWSDGVIWLTYICFCLALENLQPAARTLQFSIFIKCYFVCQACLDRVFSIKVDMLRFVWPLRFCKINVKYKQSRKHFHSQQTTWKNK
jgi:hypothetical protein